MIKKLIALIAFFGLFFGAISASAVVARADEMTNEDGLCLITPKKTVTTNHDAEYITESRWKRDIPAVDEVSHLEYRFYRDVSDKEAVNQTLYKFYRDIPAVDETASNWYRWKLVEPTTINEYRYKQIIDGTDGIKECQYKKFIKDFTTEYQYAKYTRTKTRTSEIWANFSPNDKHGIFEGPPSWPTDPDGKWEIHANIPNGHSGPNGVYQKGSGNASWFYRYAAGEWSDYGSWTLWSPLSHVSWETFDQPSIGDPAFHADGSDKGTDWYRQWQVRNTGKTRQIDNGGHWEYQWFTENPGGDWVKTDECRWKVEPVPDKVEWYPSEDGWTVDAKDDPWVIADTRVVSGPDKTTWHPSEDGWTKDVKTEPWIKVAEESRGNNDGVPGYREFKTTDGTTLVESESSEFTESTFDGWTVLSSRVEELSPAVPGWREYKMEDGTPSREIEKAAYFLEDIFENWLQLDSKKVVTQEYVPGYTEYYVPEGDPTRELGDSNWTIDEPEGWTFVDTRETLIKKAWSDTKTTPAVWEKCDETLPYTGANDSMWLYFGVASGLIAIGVILTVVVARKNI